MGLKWKDSTSYRQGDKDRKPTAWRADFSGLSLTVTHAHISNPGKWVMHFSPWYDCYDLDLPGAASERAAQLAAEDKAKGVLRHALSTLTD